MAGFYTHQYSYRFPTRYLFAKYRRYLAIWTVVFVCVSAFLLNAFLESYRLGLPDVSRLRAFQPAQTARIFASNGELIGTLFRQNRTWIPLKQMSPWLPKALIAVEDSRFYEHAGIDPVGVLRAAVADLRSRGRGQGASTITMQLARNMFLSPERSFERKLREALLAGEIEKEFSKTQILEFYLNQIYFGSGTYGVQAAASTYFHKSASALTPAQAALIAGMPQAPSELSPLVHPKRARERQELVLGRMLEMHVLSWGQYRRAMDEARRTVFRKSDTRRQLLKVPYFTTYVIQELSKRYSDRELYEGGLSIYTTVDLKLQRAAEDAVNNLVAQEESNLNVHQAALVTVENRTGAIRAMVGGRGFQTKSQFNRAWQAHRQAGSAFKPVVYTAALESGMTPTSVVDDTVARFVLGPKDIWEPHNSDNKELGHIPLWKALQESRNVVSARLVAALGPDMIVTTADRLGLPGLSPSHSLALGTAEVSPLQIASLYTTFANSGVHVQPSAILRVVDADHQVREDHREPQWRFAMTPLKARTLVWMLRRVVDYGTATLAKVPGQDTAGKTGTTDSSRDAWFVGFTPDYTTAVWTGNDDFSRMWGAFGGNLPARIFREVMTVACAGQSANAGLPWPSPAPRVSVEVCAATHQRRGPSCPKHYPIMFDASLVTQERCDKHKTAPTKKDSIQKGLILEEGARPLELHEAPEPATPTPTPSPEQPENENSTGGNDE